MADSNVADASAISKLVDERATRIPGTSGVTVGQATIAAMEICELAELAHELLSRTVGAEHDAANMALAAQKLVAQIGCVSDHLAQRLGDPGHSGGLDVWLLPPAWHSFERAH